MCICMFVCMYLSIIYLFIIYLSEYLSSTYLSPIYHLSFSASAATEYHEFNGLSNRSAFSHSSRGWQVQEQGAARFDIGEGSFQVADTTFLLVCGGERKGASCSSSTKDSDPVMGPLPSGLHLNFIASQGLTGKYHRYGKVGLQHINFRVIHSVHSSVSIFHLFII